MVFRQITSEVVVSKSLAGTISSHLETGKKVLWLTAGGSAISVAVKAAELLKGAELNNLFVSLTDERYGAVGHSDSNWQQLLDAGFSLPGAHLYPVLQENDIKQATTDYGVFLQSTINDAVYAIGLFGMGADGHTAGILPGSPAAHSKELASYYKALDYQRITITPRFIEHLDEVDLYAVRENKHSALDNLEKDIAIDQMPAQVLKKVDRLIIYNDYKGEVL